MARLVLPTAPHAPPFFFLLSAAYASKKNVLYFFAFGSVHWLTATTVARFFFLLTSLWLQTCQWERERGEKKKGTTTYIAMQARNYEAMEGEDKLVESGRETNVEQHWNSTEWNRPLCKPHTQCVFLFFFSLFVVVAAVAADRFFFFFLCCWSSLLSTLVTKHATAEKERG